MIPWAHPHPNTKSHLDQFIHFCTVHCRVSLYFTMGRPLPPQNCPLSWVDLDPHPKHGSLAYSSPQPKWHLDWFSRFCRAHYCDRLSDHTTWSVTIGHIYVCSTAMRPNDKSLRGTNQIVICSLLQPNVEAQHLYCWYGVKHANNHLTAIIQVNLCSDCYSFCASLRSNVMVITWKVL